MESFKLPGRVVTPREHSRMALSRFTRPESVDTDRLRDDINARVFTGPELPMSRHRAFSHEAESFRYWKLVAEFSRYGQCEKTAKSSPFVGEAFGF